MIPVRNPNLQEEIKNVVNDKKVNKYKKLFFL